MVSMVFALKNSSLKKFSQLVKLSDMQPSIVTKQKPINTV